MIQLNENQQSVLKQFRSSVADLQLPDSSDSFLLTWLLVQNYDVAKAGKMLRASKKWREEHRIDYILQEYKVPEVLSTKYNPIGVVGHDKSLNPVWLMRFGRQDVVGVFKSVTKMEAVLYQISMAEKAARLGKDNRANSTPKPNCVDIPQITAIFDMENYTLRQATYKPAMKAHIKAIKWLEDNYPERINRIFVINAPKVVDVAYSMIKPFLNDNTMSRISFYGPEPEVWKAAILSVVDPDQLPVSYGGSQRDPDGNPDCVTKVPMGAKIPKTFYLKRKAKKFDKSNKKSLVLGKGTSEKFEYKVKHPSSVLSWEFFSEEEAEVGFAVYRKEGDGLITVVDHEKLECHNSPEEGVIVCDQIGTYVVEFDNNFDHSTAKKIWYLVTVQSSAEKGKSWKLF